MEFIQCTMAQLNEIAALYAKVLNHLEATVNYPKWTRAYPCRADFQYAIGRGELYVCVEKGKILGAGILNTNPGGKYEAGDWSRPLERGEYLILHTLAVDPSAVRQGVGGFIVDESIALARKKGFKAVRLDVVPGNTPAVSLYKRKGFSYAGTRNLERLFKHIPEFELYELNLD